MNTPDKVVFFDGVCNLCDFSVSVLLKMDRKKQFKYSSLQGNFARKTIVHKNMETDRSFVYLSDGKFYTKTDAVILILKQLGGAYRLLGISLSVFPRRFLNALYDLIAENRYRIFGKKEHCRIPSEEETKLFID
ncbi:MAG: DCC1-like thiol-disulfide oxidoreductase family protein [Bdellovibrionota bacterium]